MVPEHVKGEGDLNNYVGYSWLNIRLFVVVDYSIIVILILHKYLDDCNFSTDKNSSVREWKIKSFSC